MPATPAPDESSPLEPIRHTENDRTLGWGQFDAMPSGYPNETYGGGILYGGRELAAAQSLVLAPMEAFYRDPAPYKVAEEWQGADITYAVAYADQDYRRMNEAQANANTWRTKLPKATPRPSTSEIITNLTNSPGVSQASDDASIMALFGL